MTLETLSYILLTYNIEKKRTTRRQHLRIISRDPFWGSKNCAYVVTKNEPVMAIFADHFEVPSSTDCLTAFM